MNRKTDFDFLTELVKFMKKNGLCEMEMGEGADKIRLQLPSQGKAEVSAKDISVNLPQQVSESAGNQVISGEVVQSPMVGTFYQSASPEVDPFVKVGDHVKKGQVLCVIEAMKTMNQIEAEEEGTISEILVENAQPVEYGEPLFKLRK